MTSAPNLPGPHRAADRELPPQRDARLSRLLAPSLERLPEAVAIWFEDRTLSFAELDRRSERLARLLRRRGVGPETRVGVLAEPAPEVVVALLAISRAGGALVPLDPDDSPTRIELVRQDAGLALVLTQSRLVPRLAEGVGEVLCLDRIAGLAGEEAGDTAPDEPLAVPETSPAGLAQVVYGPGPTGRPAGAMHTLGGVRHSL